jgi:glucose-6-phosphate isomerase
MSVIRPRHPEDPLGHEATGPDGGLWKPGSLAGPLAEARRSLLAEPADPDLPRRLLAEYDTRRSESRLFAVLAEARRIRDLVDRLVVVSGGGHTSGGGIAAGTRLLVDCCCHPFHDQLPRGERGGRPRLTWIDGRFDNDRLHGLLDLIAPAGRSPSDDLLDRWAILAIELSSDDLARDDLPGLTTLRLLLATLLGGGDGGRNRVSERFVAVAAAGSRLTALAQALECRGRFTAEPELDSPAGLFTTAGLLPAAIAGIDVVQLLKGAAAMLVRFAEAPQVDNPVLADAATCVAARAIGLPGRSFSGGGRHLAELATWQGDIRPVFAGAAAFVTHLSVGTPRRDRLVLPGVAAAATSDGLDELVGHTWPERVAATPSPEPLPLPGPTATIRLPRLDEHAVGQLLQLLVLSSAVERRL